MWSWFIVTYFQDLKCIILWFPSYYGYWWKIWYSGVSMYVNHCFSFTTLMLLLCFLYLFMPCHDSSLSYLEFWVFLAFGCLFFLKGLVFLDQVSISRLQKLLHLSPSPNSWVLMVVFLTVFPISWMILLYSLGVFLICVCMYYCHDLPPSQGYSLLFSLGLLVMVSALFFDWFFHYLNFCLVIMSNKWNRRCQRPCEHTAGDN